MGLSPLAVLRLGLPGLGPALGGRGFCYRIPTDTENLPKNMKNLPDQTLAYIAGLVDGEGTVTVSRRHKDPARTREWRAKTEVTNTNIEILQWLMDETGIGSVHVSRPTHPNHKPKGRWMLHGTGAAEFLGAILPWLRIKKPHAELVLAFHATKQRPNRNRPVPADLVAERVAISNQLYTLNQRGVVG